MSMLSRAVKKYDAAFAALPDHVQRDLAVFGVRALPLLRQLSERIGPLFDNAALKEAGSAVLFALACRIAKKMSLEAALSDDTLKELNDNAPRFAGLVRAVVNADRLSPQPIAALTEADTKPERLLR